MNVLDANIIGSIILQGMTGPEPLPNPPVVDFSVSDAGPTAGSTVLFTDLTANIPTVWNWQFPGGTPTGATAQNPSVTYNTVGTYNVTLTASNAGGTGSLTKTNYISVSTAAPVVDFSASPTGPTAGNTVTFTDLSTNTPTAWNWQFPGGSPTGSTAQNPAIIYGSTGTYSVTLTASNTGGTGNLTKTNYITVKEQTIVEQTFTGNGTWSCCPGALCAEVIAVGGGGGGAAGGARGIVDPTHNDRGIAGGAGGGGGAVVIATITGAQLTSSVCVVVGGAGSGGAGVSATCWPGNNGNPGSAGGNSCFGGFLIARGGKTPGDGGYAAVSPGGINSCPGQGGTGAILCGTGTVCNGGNGGGMQATNASCLDGLPAANVASTTRAPGGGAGGSMWYCNTIIYEGCWGAGQNANTVCGLTLGSSGRGGGVTGCNSCPPTASAGYGAGGAGSAASCLQSGNAEPGRCGVIKVIQYF